MEKITIEEVEYTINYQETKIGDKVVNKNNNTIYEANIHDADDMNWIIIE
jgi:hypothetical protein